MRILINDEPLDWPKPFITEEQLRAYADAEPGDTVVQDGMLGMRLAITGTANVYEGATFHTIKGTP